MTIKRMAGLLFISVLVILLSIFSQDAEAADRGKLAELLEQRSCTVWVEGQQLGDMILGARARMDFFVIDHELSRFIAANPDVPEWLKWNNGYFGSGSKNSILVVARYKTFKIWDFDIEKIYIDDYRLLEKDVATRKAFVQKGILPSDTEGSIAFFVPREGNRQNGKKGEITFSYENYSCTIKK